MATPDEIKKEMIAAVTKIINEAVEVKMNIEFGTNEIQIDRYIQRQPNGIRTITITTYPGGV